MFMKFLVVLVLVTLSVQAGRLSEKAAEYMQEGMYFYNQISRMIRTSIQAGELSERAAEAMSEGMHTF
jgi:hypothetical protein